MASHRAAASIVLPDPVFTRMELVASPRREKGGPPNADVNSWIELSDAQHVSLSKLPDGGDAELSLFLNANDGEYRYDYVRLACTFCPQHKERFEKAWLNITLMPDAQQAARAPVAWSIFPLEDHDTAEDEAGAKFGIDAKIITAETSISSKEERKLFKLRGYREGSASPYWEMYSTEASTLDGVLRFHMVVRSLASSATLGAMRLEAVISNRSYVIFRQRRPFDRSPSSTFRLPPA
jgi:hypothetical protein